MPNGTNNWVVETYKYKLEKFDVTSEIAFKKNTGYYFCQKLFQN